MSKIILFIKGSCRKGSVTNAVWQEAIKSIENVKVEVFDAFREKFEFCDGCNYCETNGKCINRDLDEFFEKFEDADVIVFSSPVYNGGFSAPVKALIDRFQVYYTAFYKNGKVQPIKKRRKGILLTAAGRKGTDALENMEKNLKCAFTILNMDFEDSVLCPETDAEFCCKEQIEKLKVILKRSLSDE